MADKVVDQLNAKSAEEIKDVTIIDLQMNSISDAATLSICVNLIKLNLAKNKLKSLAPFCTDESFPNLKWLDVSNNKFSDFPAIKCPKLEYLDISYNKLEKVSEAWTGHDRLRIVKSIDNKFKNLAPFKSMPKLEELYMAQNLVSTLTGWENLPVLRKLHLRKNKIEKMPEEEMPDLPALEYLNMRRNNIEKIEVIEKLFQFKMLTDINVLNNPIDQNASSKDLLFAQVLSKNPAIKRFNKQQVTEKNLLQAVHYGQYKFEKDEKERKRLEALEAAKAEDEK